MAEETKASTPSAVVEVVTVVAESEATSAPLVELKKEETKDIPLVIEETSEKTTEVVGGAETEKPKEGEEQVTEEVAQSSSLKEECKIVSEVEDPEKKALDEFKQLIQLALNNHEFTSPTPKPEEKKPEEEEKKTETEEKKPEVEEKKTEVEEKKESNSEETHIESTPKEPESNPEPIPEPVKEEEEKKEEVSVPEPVVEAPVVDEDGAKTVEAIEETIVVVQSTKEPELDLPATTTTESDTVVVLEETTVVVVEEEEQAPPPPPEEVSIYGIPLLADERTDTILLKFLKARDFKVKEAFTMLKNVVSWRKEFGIDELIEEDLGTDLEKVVFINGVDKEGHLVCYNVFGEFLNKELYQKTFSDTEKSQKFLKWRIQFLEKSIRKLDFTPGGISTIVQINDMKNSPGPFKSELRIATNQALSLLQDNYPEFVAKQIFINVPWWYLAVNRMISPFLTQRTKSKFLFAGPSRSAETLFKYIAPEQVPVQFGGLNKVGEKEFSTEDAVTEITIKPLSKQTVELPVSEISTLVWELRVIGWEVTYCSEFIPDAENGYTVIVSKTRKLISTDEPVLCSSFKIGEPGKVVLTIDNPTSKKKKLLYRSKTKPSSD